MKESAPHPDRLDTFFQDRWLVLSALGALLALAAGVLAAHTLYVDRTRQAAVLAPAFVLRDQNGSLTSLAQFRGKVVALTFIDPECTQLCPLTTQSMVEALKILGPAAASQVQLLGIDANPLKTQVSDVASYTRTHELQGRWRFLTGSDSQLKTAWQNYHVYVAVKNNDIQHTAVVVLIDRRGYERDLFSTPMSYQAVGDQARTLAQGIASLLPRRPWIDASVPAGKADDSPLAPSDSLRLAALGPHSQVITLGSSHPHLVVFFAGWLDQSGDLSKDLATLDRYAALARRHGWPSPVAVDVLPTEPSPAEARQVLDLLAASLHTPIVQDSSGRLADGYHVADLPWFVLNSSSGKILWRHDGWLSSSALDRDVRHAMSGT